MPNDKNYPEQFYPMPRRFAPRDIQEQNAKTLVAIANECHGMRVCLEKLTDVITKAVEQKAQA